MLQWGKARNWTPIQILKKKGKEKRHRFDFPEPDGFILKQEHNLEKNINLIITVNISVKNIFTALEIGRFHPFIGHEGS